jgi:hypothetical protein
MVFPVVVLVFDFNEFSEGVLHGHSRLYILSLLFYFLFTPFSHLSKHEREE